MFPHSISHSNNGERLISIEFLPSLFNRFAVLSELSKRFFKSNFFCFFSQNFQPFSFSSLPAPCLTVIRPPPMIPAVPGQKITWTSYINVVFFFFCQFILTSRRVCGEKKKGKSTHGVILHVELAATTRFPVQNVTLRSPPPTHTHTPRK